LRENQRYPRFSPTLSNDCRAAIVRIGDTLRRLVEGHLRGRCNLAVVDWGCGSKAYAPLFQGCAASYVGIGLPTNPCADVVLRGDGSTGLGSVGRGAVLSTRMLEHVESGERYLAESFRILRPGGLLIPSTHGCRPCHPDPTDCRRWTGAGLRKVLERAGHLVLDWEGILSLAAVPLQLLHDAPILRLPKIVRAPLVPGAEFARAMGCRDSPAGRDNDAWASAAVARRPFVVDGEGSTRVQPAVTEGQQRADRGPSPGALEEPKEHGVDKMGTDGALRVAVVFPNRSAYSETFIKDHVQRLPYQVTEWWGGWFPTHWGDGKPLFSGLDRVTRFAVRKRAGDLERLASRVLARQLRRQHIDVVLAEYGPTGVAVMSACQTAGIPLVVYFLGFDAYHRPTLAAFGRRYRDLFDFASAIVVVSRHMERQLIELGAPKEKLIYNACGVDPSAFNMADPANAEPVFVAAGRFVEKKAPQITLLAFQQVVQKCPAARLVMVGDGALLDSCRQLARGIGLSSEQVSFPGAVSHAEVADLMRRARAFVQHSVVAPDGDSEGIPVAIKEAGASGLPVVSTRHAGIPEGVVEGETGFLVDEYDVGGMAEHMIRLAEDPRLAARLGQAARALMERQFSMESCIGGLADVLRRVAEAGRRDRP
jgi:colanic acid/amylovoran biosynthesis glycosyltransferase